MAGFQKPKPMQAALKMAIYGGPGSGKTFTSLLIAEGLAERTGKRIAFVDTERGTDFYMQEVPQRQVHPESFAEHVDMLYTQSITEVAKAIEGLSEDDYCCVIIDSMTHLWKAAMDAYRGPRTSAGTIPFHAWGRIKKPYKDMENRLMNSTFHVMLLGRQGVDYQDDEDTGETKAIGYKMKAEGETPYEPHILLRIEQPKRTKGNSVVLAFAEKDRTGVLAGKTIEWPTFDNIAAPILATLGDAQAQMPTTEETKIQDQENLDRAEAEKRDESTELLRTYKARFDLAESEDDVKAIGKELTPKVKAKMLSEHVTELREAARQAFARADKKRSVEPETDPDHVEPGTVDRLSDDESRHLHDMMGVRKDGVPFVHVRKTEPEESETQPGDLWVDFSDLGNGVGCVLHRDNGEWKSTLDAEHVNRCHSFVQERVMDRGMVLNKPTEDILKRCKEIGSMKRKAKALGHVPLPVLCAAWEELLSTE